MDETLKNIVDRIVQHINPTKIYLFGSRARGDYRPDSDYDLVIAWDGEDSSREIELQIRAKLRDIRCAKDIIVLTSDHIKNFKDVPLSLANEIAENGVILYG